MTVEIVEAAGLDQVGESPLWSPAEEVLWWVDIEGRALRRFDPASGRCERWATEERPACLALHAGGGLVVGMETGIFRLQPRPDGTLAAERLAAVDHPAPGMRFNDGRADRAGRFWAGTMVRDMALAAPAGRLYRWSGHGAPTAVVDGFVTQNGLAFSPGGETLYVSDSHPSVRRVWAYDLASDGGLSRRREFVDMNHHSGRPDGAAVDVDGCYWTCANDAGLVHRFTPDGRLDRSLALPVAKPSMCAFGDADLATLYVTSIRPPDAPAGSPAGGLFALRPGVAGLAERPVAITTPERRHP